MIEYVHNPGISTYNTSHAFGVSECERDNNTGLNINIERVVIPTTPVNTRD